MKNVSIADGFMLVEEDAHIKDGQTADLGRLFLNATSEKLFSNTLKKEQKDFYKLRVILKLP